jgi:hypothetical protein
MTETPVSLLVQQLPKFRFDPNGGFRAWLWTVFRRQVLAWRKRQGRESPMPTADLEGLAAPDALFEATEAEYRRALLDRALRLVQADFLTRTWQIFLQAAVQGRPAAESAQEFDPLQGEVNAPAPYFFQNSLLEINLSCAVPISTRLSICRMAGSPFISGFGVNDNFFSFIPASGERSVMSVRSQYNSSSGIPVSGDSSSRRPVFYFELQRNCLNSESARIGDRSATLSVKITTGRTVQRALRRVALLPAVWTFCGLSSSEWLHFIP